MLDYDRFLDFANSLSSGYLKNNKAYNMIHTMDDLKIYKEQARLTNYLTNCLEMEGFKEQDIHKISMFVYDNWV